MVQQKTVVCIVCRDGGPDCDFEVRDSDAEELLTIVQSHARRKHDLDLTLDQLRPLLRNVKQTDSV
jgi:predicted small metal-binding protein